MIGFLKNNMNEIERQKRIDFLKSAYRLTWSENDEGGVNRTHGLFMLAKDLIKPDFTVAEIGSFSGVSSEVLALHCKKLVCIDTWEDWSGDGIIYKALAKFEEMRSFYTHIDKHHMRGDQASSLYTDQHFDLVYIDASHWYNDVVNDINCWLPKIKSGGYLSGHDYVPNIDVTKAVNDYFKSTHAITIYPDSSWVIKKS